MNPTEARRRIDAIRADQGHPFFAESHPGHGRAVRDMEALYAQAYPEPAVENPFDWPVPVKAVPPADPGLKHREPGAFWQQSASIPREELEAAQALERSAGDWWRKSGKKAEKAIAQGWRDFLTRRPVQKPSRPMTPEEAKMAALNSAALLPRAVRAQQTIIHDVLRRRGKLPAEEIRIEDIPTPRWDGPDWIGGGLLIDNTGDVIWIDRHQPDQTAAEEAGEVREGPFDDTNWTKEEFDRN